MRGQEMDLVTLPEAKKYEIGKKKGQGQGQHPDPKTEAASPEAKKWKEYDFGPHNGKKKPKTAPGSKDRKRFSLRKEMGGI